ncbi:Dam family site-specific DNA-(adenine-N6)-methyltransferase [Phocoenobacter skyensis]|uniref:Site-specific DNA-methyltransferase (adenine-specific) n=1 Tax=Phocoenobacter skyensis TaxID=97481 RepID=A0A1H7XDN4_9PAST|nr:Dam family site-specific DNA-(adenine-N6)-methyltransferase [Pasteurella skyensis]MDP8079676.1 Dam family site-specific DNA-(adenine-N6)-methyltransferase [Pasteurella skyensis]MDP8085624.1 Dam family site-specific DNA-(adenine-N6)-methyltransferase [Pasteurella skyensis]MDP8170571.1 Dam family site-specific DNA-(adenine-N6)-methyltransferase [Pasteurella skyensis]MDP8174602.1 Dam family site-specific DNA-(adenine-N6)-methyltransferase [Pasteurella skyensis]MDP8185393.1 Dam family site-spec
MNVEKRRPFLKWAGGKYRLVPEIRKHLPEGKCLVEPFVGAGAVFLNTDYDRYILADINPDLINLFNTVKNDVEHYITEVENIFSHKNANSKSFYYDVRTEFNDSSDTFRRSVLFLYLNRFGFNGLCRYNKKHKYNVPFGHYTRHYFPEKELYFFAQKAQKAEFLCADFKHTFDYLQQRKDDYIIYCDPPYAPLIQDSNFTHYSGGGFDLEQQQKLAKSAIQLSRKNIPVLISNHDTPFTREIYSDAELFTFPVQRFIGQNPKSRVKVNELFALFNL